MVTDTVEDPAQIEREIRRTQDDMSSTVDKIGDQLSIKNMFNALLDKADESDINTRFIVDGARRNPVALGLIAAGAIWLLSDHDAKLPKMGSKSGKKRLDAAEDFDAEQHDYLTHMSAVQQQADEDFDAYNRRRDAARSSYFNTERAPDEDEGTFSKRLDTLAEKFRNKRHDWAARSADGRDAAKLKAQAAIGKTQNMYAENPMVGGMLAAAIGAALGSALSATRPEKESLGALGKKARDTVNVQMDRVTGRARDKKDELLTKADEMLSYTKASNGAMSDQQNAMTNRNASNLV